MILTGISKRTSGKIIAVICYGFPSSINQVSAKSKLICCTLLIHIQYNSIKNIQNLGKIWELHCSYPIRRKNTGKTSRRFIR